MTLGYLFFFPFFLDLCDATRRCCLLYTVIIQSVSGAQRRPRLLLTFLDPWIIKMPLAMRSSCKLFLVLHLGSNISFWQRARSDRLRKVQIRCFFCTNTFFPPSTPALAAPHSFSKSVCSIKTNPNKGL